MKREYRSFYARWWDELGKEHRKAFATYPLAKAYQDRIRAEIRAKKVKALAVARSLISAQLGPNAKRIALTKSLRAISRKSRAASRSRK